MVKSIFEEKPNICNHGFGEYKTFNISRLVEVTRESEETGETETVEQYECWSHTVKNPKVADIVPVFVNKDIELTDEEKEVIREECELSTRDELITAIIRARYSADNVEAIICNRDDGNERHEAEYNELQEWRKKAKEMSKEYMEVLDETLEEAIERKLMEINQYDNSSEVNSFKYNGVDLWIDKDTRNTFMTSILSAEQRGAETIIAPVMGGVEFSIDSAKAVLSQLQGYCDEAGVVTYRHIENVKALTSVDEVNAYDFKADYPAKLEF